MVKEIFVLKQELEHLLDIPFLFLSISKRYSAWNRISLQNGELGRRHDLRLPHSLMPWLYCPPSNASGLFTAAIHRIRPSIPWHFICTDFCLAKEKLLHCPYGGDGLERPLHLEEGWPQVRILVEAGPSQTLVLGHTAVVKGEETGVEGGRLTLARDVASAEEDAGQHTKV